jgi:hypothetical protein
LTDTERLKCLKEILRINPNHEQAKQRYNELTGMEAKPIEPVALVAYLENPDKWYRSSTVKILAFLFFLPLWSLIAIDDPKSGTLEKVIAIILLVIYILIACQLITGYSPIRLF